jgi:hypothetical protein
MLKPKMSDIIGIGDAQVKNKWNINFTSIPSALAGFNANKLNFHAETVTPPTKEAENVPVEIRGHKKMQPGNQKYSEVFEIDFVETEDNMLKDFVKKWRELCQRPNTGSNSRLLECGCVISIEMLGTDDKPIWTQKQYHVIYKKSNLDQLDNASEAYKLKLETDYTYFVDGAKLSPTPSIFN